MQNVKTSISFSLPFVISFFLSLTAYTQNSSFSVSISTENKTSAVDDVSAKAVIKGGKAPFIFLWNQSSISIYESEVEGLSEGENIEVTVIDADKNSVSASAYVKPSSFEEKINHVLKPAVDGLSKILFTNIWSDTIRTSSYALKAPQALRTEKGQYILKKWLVDEGEKVTHLQPIALLEREGDVFPFYAIENGTLTYATKKEGVKIKEGDEVVRYNARGNLTEQILGHIIYEKPVPYLNKNLTTQVQGIPLIVAWLMLGAIFFTFKMRFIQFKGFSHSIQLIRGFFDNPKEKEGEVTHFQALVTALSATTGLGNIAGVAIAISLGGAGASFWIILAGFFGMATKFVECTLGVKYRIINKDGEVSGGPMYYLSRGLAKRGSNMGKLGKTLAFLFAVLAVGGSFGIGNMFQANQAFNQLSAIPGWQGIAKYGFLFGVLLAVAVGFVIVGGIKKIANVTSKIVPLMVGVYILTGLAIIIINYQNIPSGFNAIFQGAFNSEAIYGGFIGVMIMGMRRATFSNEAGIGSAPIAHAAVRTKEPVSEGIVGLLEPFIDTVVVCTMTALIIIFSGYAIDHEGYEGAALTTVAFAHSLGDWSIYVLTLSVLLFAYSTMISWSYYGLKSFTYLLGNKKKIGLIYNLVFLVFIVIGSSVGLGAVMDFSDLMILAMAFPNVLGLIIMSGEVRRDTIDYFKRIKSGAIQKLK